MEPPYVWKRGVQNDPRRLLVYSGSRFHNITILSISLGTFFLSIIEYFLLAIVAHVDEYHSEIVGTDSHRLK